MRIPKEFKLTQNQCKAPTNKQGLLSKLPPIAKEVGIEHYPLLCMLNNCKPMASYSNNSYQFCYNKLLNNAKIQIMASIDDVKTITFHKDKQNNAEMICYKDKKFEERAYLLAYLEKMLREAPEKERTKLISFNSSYNYLMGELYGYKDEEIQGFYLQRYLLKYIPPKIKSKMMKYVTDSDFEWDFISFKTKITKLYDALKKVDGFKDFETKILEIKSNRQLMAQNILNSKKFQSFKRTHKPERFKFDISELKDTFPDDYTKLAPKLNRFKKSLTK